MWLSSIVYSIIFSQERDHLILSNPYHWEILRTIESSLITIVLEDNSPSCLDEVSIGIYTLHIQHWPICKYAWTDCLIYTFTWAWSLPTAHVIYVFAFMWKFTDQDFVNQYKKQINYNKYWNNKEWKKIFKNFSWFSKNITRQKQ